MDDRKSLLRFLLWFALANAGLFWLIGLKYLITQLSSKSLFATTVYAYTAITGKCLVIFFAFITYIGHFALLAFLPLFIIVMPLIFLLKRTYVIIPIAVMTAFSSVLLLVADSLIFSLYHFHLNMTLLSMAFAERHEFAQFFNLSRHEMLEIDSICLMILVLESALAALVWKKVVLAARWQFEKKVWCALSACLSLSYIICIFSMAAANNIFAQQTPNLPLYNQILATLLPIHNSLSALEFYSETKFSQPLFPVSVLRYPLHALNCRIQAKPYNIVMIGIDSWRFDALNPQLMPATAAFAKHAWQFQQHVSGGNATQPGVFSLFYSLPGNYWTSMLQLQQGPVLIHELLKQGYQATIIFSGDMLVPPFNQTVFREIDHLRVQHAPGVTVPDRDHAVTTEFLQFLAQRDRQQPFFSFLFYDSAHNYCTRQNIPMIYKTTSLDCSRLTISDSPADHDMHSRYNNAVHYVDTQVALVLTALKEQGLLDNTIILLTGDHGEEFSDDQQAYFSHASNYTKYQIQTPFVLYWPRQTPAIWTHQTSHYDIAPYLLKHVLGCRNPLDDYSLGKDLLTGERPDYLLVGSYMNMAIVEKNRYTTLLASGDIRITDNQAKEVPGARVDLNILKRALFEMRKFYR